MRLGSLFSGIGGLELGLERSGLVSETVWQVEIDPARRAVLARHWPRAEQFIDVRTVGKLSQTDSESVRYDLQPVEVICGGFPCQDLSDASRGRGGGIDGKRSGLWREYVRIVRELRPAIVVVENVAGAAARKWLPPVRQHLHVLGYRTRALRVDAADVGAPHARARVFVVGYANAHPQPARSLNGQVGGVFTSPTLGGRWREPKPGVLRVANGLSRGLDNSARLEMLGDAVVPDCAELIGRLIRYETCNQEAA